MLVPFAEVVLLTAIEYQREDKEEKEKIENKEEESKDEEDEHRHPDLEVPPEVCQAWKASKERKKFSLTLDLKKIGRFTLCL